MPIAAICRSARRAALFSNYPILASCGMASKSLSRSNRIRECCKTGSTVRARHHGRNLYTDLNQRQRSFPELRVDATLGFDFMLHTLGFRWFHRAKKEIEIVVLASSAARILSQRIEHNLMKAFAQLSHAPSQIHPKGFGNEADGRFPPERRYIRMFNSCIMKENAMAK